MGRGSSPRYPCRPDYIASRCLTRCRHRHLPAAGCCCCGVQLPMTRSFSSPAAAAAALVSAGAGLLVGFASLAVRGVVGRPTRWARAPVGGQRPKMVDELGALDAAMGRLPCRLDRFIRDVTSSRASGRHALMEFDGPSCSSTPPRRACSIPGAVPGQGDPFRRRALPRSEGNTQLGRLLRAPRGEASVHRDEVLATTATGQPLLLEVTIQRRDAAHGFSRPGDVLPRRLGGKRRIREQIRRADQLASSEAWRRVWRTRSGTRRR